MPTQPRCESVRLLGVDWQERGQTCRGVWPRRLKERSVFQKSLRYRYRKSLFGIKMGYGKGKISFDGAIVHSYRAGI
jgi:hypothetical protein